MLPIRQNSVPDEGESYTSGKEKPKGTGHKVSRLRSLVGAAAVGISVLGGVGAAAGCKTPDTMTAPLDNEKEYEFKGQTYTLDTLMNYINEKGITPAEKEKRARAVYDLISMDTATGNVRKVLEGIPIRTLLELDSRSNPVKKRVLDWLDALHNYDISNIGLTVENLVELGPSIVGLQDQQRSGYGSYLHALDHIAATCAISDCIQLFKSGSTSKIINAENYAGLLTTVFCNNKKVTPADKLKYADTVAVLKNHEEIILGAAKADPNAAALYYDKYASHITDPKDVLTEAISKITAADQQQAALNEAVATAILETAIVHGKFDAIKFVVKHQPGVVFRFAAGDRSSEKKSPFLSEMIQLAVQSSDPKIVRSALMNYDKWSTENFAKSALEKMALENPAIVLELVQQILKYTPRAGEEGLEFVKKLVIAAAKKDPAAAVQFYAEYSKLPGADEIKKEASNTILKEEEKK